MLDVDKIKSIVSKISTKYGIKSAYLFGSYAKGTANEESDVDILIDRGEIHDFKTYSNFYNDLVDELNKDVDLVTTAGIKPSFYNLIKNDRILLYRI